ncbi:MAG TPA: hypothetical protein VFT50_11610 [Baekduia sp.]|nr:hypothetical protein [Baekduia sp.]
MSAVTLGIVGLILAWTSFGAFIWALCRMAADDPLEPRPDWEAGAVGYPAGGTQSTTASACPPLDGWTVDELEEMWRAA